MNKLHRIKPTHKQILKVQALKPYYLNNTMKTQLVLTLLAY
jgi:hypothetical protein